ncbi:hypothetical protein TVAG_344530 [Trichomonas vaginalis G3]|uniref:Beta-1,4-mannosyltransferase n=1 Tax=Trichomonas vaginalis (strain ATCC PRA-98 / G3) TaxID=412133 RepID=A2FRG7_TRIV3|nr:beta1,4 mannosyltransferase family [Trichomonas vaginalis G3]EAX92497.1 hypothetical protein TVAG_344530 [Trichomonas vaginalis G3]KAI5498299.1 beta1,4 mannosyltransferase family [Trichomonas vaginalis G3]|eukprot:XP_001305427.1 hypothetical protein [Trichomonas vaginalis G3]
MPNCILFTLDDYANNHQIISHIQVLSKVPENHIYVIGLGSSKFPRDIQNTPNLSVKRITPFPMNLFLMRYLFLPFSFIFTLFQVIGILIQLPTIDIFVVYLHHIIKETIVSWIVTKLFHIRLIFELGQYTLANEGYLVVSKSVETMLLKLSNVNIVPTQAKQMILHFRGIKSFLIRNIPMRVKDLSNRVEFMNNHIVGYMYPYSKTEEILKLNKIMKDLEEHQMKIDFYIFGTSKSVTSADTILKNHKSEFITYKYISLSDPNYFELLQRCNVGIILSSSFVLDPPQALFHFIGAGVPIIANHFGCISEEITNNDNGFLVSENENFSKKLLEVLRNENVVKMRRKLLEMYNSHFEDAYDVFMKILKNESPPQLNNLFT